jgi:hypothetical protein
MNRRDVSHPQRWIGRDLLINMLQFLSSTQALSSSTDSLDLVSHLSTPDRRKDLEYRQFSLPMHKWGFQPQAYMWQNLGLKS